MDLNAGPFRAFLKVAELESFTRAAEALNISQPALSASIKELERRLGFPLFERSSRRVCATREGEALLVNAKRVVIETDWLQQRVRDIRDNELRIGVQHSSALVSERVALTDSFLADHAGIAVQIIPFSHPKLYDSIGNGDLDVALILEPTARTELSPINAKLGTDLEELVIEQKPLNIRVPTGHRLFDRAFLTGEDLAGQAVATVNRIHGGAMGSALMRHLMSHGARIVRPPEGDALSVARYAAANNMLAIDLGWFSMPQLNCYGGPRTLPLEGAERFSDLVVLRLRREARPAAERFWRHCEAGRVASDAAALG